MWGKRVNRTRADRQRVLVMDLDESIADVEQTLKGLASEQRLRILKLLGDRVCSVSEIAEAMGMPASTATLHIKKLEQAGLIKTELTPADRGLQKVCSRLYDRVTVNLPRAKERMAQAVEIAMPIGSYVDCQVMPTCGLVGELGVIGLFDDPTSFYEPEHVYAQLIWFRQGYVEYRFPNRLPPRVLLDSLQLSMEICSEAPLHHDDWPSDITVWINGREIGTWTSPADFGGQRGNLTPDWWEDWNTQHGLLKVWQVAQNGSFVDGVRVSDTKLADLGIDRGPYTIVRIGVKEDAMHVGGINIFGSKFGNYPQDIILTLHFERDGNLARVRSESQ